jgi:hypothetical protein
MWLKVTNDIIRQWTARDFKSAAGMTPRLRGTLMACKPWISRLLFPRPKTCSLPLGARRIHSYGWLRQLLTVLERGYSHEEKEQRDDATEPPAD